MGRSVFIFFLTLIVIGSASTAIQARMTASKLTPENIPVALAKGASKQTSPSQSEESPRSFVVNQILELSVDSSINPAVYNYLSSGYKKAKEENYQLLLIKLNTPGGLVSTTKQILALIGESDIPTVIWVTPEGASATSAGAIIASGAHVLMMSKGTNIGAATPIQLSQDIKEGDAKNKAVNDLVALVQGLAKARGRNPEGFAKMISEAASFDSTEAMEKKLIDGVVSTRAELLNFISGRNIIHKGVSYKLSAENPNFDLLEMDLGQKLLNVFAVRKTVSLYSHRIL